MDRVPALASSEERIHDDKCSHCRDAVPMTVNDVGQCDRNATSARHTIPPRQARWALYHAVQCVPAKLTWITLLLQPFGVVATKAVHEGGDFQ